MVYNPEQDGACGTAIEEEGMVITHSLHMCSSVGPATVLTDGRKSMQKVKSLSQNALSSLIPTMRLSLLHPSK